MSQLTALMPALSEQPGEGGVQLGRSLEFLSGECGFDRVKTCPGMDYSSLHLQSNNSHSLLFRLKQR